MKRSALKRAWVKRWNKASFGKCRPIVAIITPSWLSVDKAMIFFKSVSLRAAVLAKNIVREPVRRSRVLKRGSEERNG